jgi:Protein of unknown function (DUF4231)
MDLQNEMDEYIQKRYREAIDYYWAASINNKRWYKMTRSFTVIIGALVTLIASLASSKILVDTPMETMFALGTPILAAILTIVAGFSQSFQWGSTWQNMILTAQQLQKEFDFYLVTPINKRDFNEEANKLNGFVIKESEGFFERMLGGGKPSIKDNDQGDNGK